MRRSDGVDRDAYDGLIDRPWLAPITPSPLEPRLRISVLGELSMREEWAPPAAIQVEIDAKAREDDPDRCIAEGKILDKLWSLDRICLREGYAHWLRTAVEINRSLMLFGPTATQETYGGQMTIVAVLFGVKDRDAALDAMVIKLYRESRPDIMALWRKYDKELSDVRKV